MRDIRDDFIVFIAAILVSAGMSVIAEAKENSKWVEQQCIDLPKSILLHEGKTSSGNPKYWFEFDKIGKVTVSPGSAEKYQDGLVTLQLVKWRHKETGEYKYSIRQKKGSEKKQTLNIDLLTIFNQ